MTRLLLLIVLAPALAIGQSTAEIERNATIVTDPTITGYISRIAHDLAKTAKLSTPLTIKLISGPDACATTLPGGFLYVNTKLISAAATESELAAVIAHQIGHLAQPLPMPLTSIGGPAGLCVRNTPGSIVLPMSDLTTIRGLEEKADELALTFLAAARYDPSALPDFFARIANRKPGSIGRVFDLGLTVSPSIRARAEMQQNAGPVVVTTSDFQEMKQKVAALDPARPTAQTIGPSLKRIDGK
jgi:predicted Zn-dependent protease